MGRIRFRRLDNDFRHMMVLHNSGGLIHVIAIDGDPPERYVVGFRCRGVREIDADDSPLISDEHRVELILTAEYPRFRPRMRWLTPIFHPNFDDQGNICIKKWYPQQRLVDLCAVLAEMVQYKNYNTTSPLDMDAAMWAMRHRDELPIDDRPLFAKEAAPDTPAAVAQSVYAASVVVTGTLPIQPTTGTLPIQPVPENSPPPGRLARFCKDCGEQFLDPNVLQCPQCGTPRQTLEEN